MCSVHSKIIMVAITYGGTTRLHDFRRKTVAPQMYTNDQQTDLYYIIGTGRSKVGTADAPQRIDLRRAPSLVYLPIIHNTNLCRYLPIYAFHIVVLQIDFMNAALLQ